MFEEFDGGYENSFDLLYLHNEPVMVYDRPVYTQDTDDSDDSHIILYDGGRYVVSRRSYFEDRGNESFVEYLTVFFNAEYSVWTSEYISEPSNLASPANVPFRAHFTDAAEDSIGRLGDGEYTPICADCITDGIDGVSFCTDRGGFRNDELCMTEFKQPHGKVNRCACPPGFRGPLCHIRPIEGTSTLYLDRLPMCSVCNEGNPWTLYYLDGTTKTCEASPLSEPLFFQDINGTSFTRRIGLYLNMTHFSVFVSSSNETVESLCETKDGTKEIYSMERTASEETIHLDFAIHLDNRKDFFGEIVKPSHVECTTKSGVGDSTCAGNLARVYTTKTQKSTLQNAWLLLDALVTHTDQPPQSQ